MKRLLLPLLAAITLPTSVEANWFGKYKSKIGAEEACLIWASKGFKYTYEDMVFESGGSSYAWLNDVVSGRGKNVMKTFNGITRYCELERETNQYLGFEKTGINQKHYTEYVYENLAIGRKIKKYFKF